MSTQKNLEKAEKTLKELGLVPTIPLDAKNVFHFREEYIQKRHLIAWNFYNPQNPTHQVDIIINYDLKNGTTKTIQSTCGKIKILSRKELIAMKKKAGRPQDLEDAKALENL